MASIPSCRGHQLHGFFRVFHSVFHLNWVGFWRHRFSENSDGLMKSFILGVCSVFFIVHTLFLPIITDDEFYGLGDIPLLSDESLIRAQRSLRRNKELSILITIGIYALNIIDANVDAHLLQYNMDKNLAVHPFINFDTPESSAQLGLSINYNF